MADFQTMLAEAGFTSAHDYLNSSGMHPSPVTEFFRPRVGSQLGRDEIAAAFQQGLQAMLVHPEGTHSLLVRMSQVVDEIEEPDADFDLVPREGLDTGSHPTIALSAIVQRGPRVIQRGWDMMRGEVKSSLDAWGFGLLHEASTDLGESENLMVDLNNAIDHCGGETGWVFLNARQFFAGRDAFDMETSRPQLYRGVTAYYRDHEVCVHRLIPAGSVYVTAGFGDISYDLSVKSADEPPNAVGWSAEMQAKATVKGGAFFHFTET